MANDNTARYRSNEPYSRGPAAAAPANDPLAELARLIGQSDPFSEVRREPRPPEHTPSPNFGAASPPSYPSGPTPDYDEPPRYAPEPLPPYEPAPSYDPAPRYAADYPPQHHADTQPSHQDWPGSPPSYSHAPQHDAFGLPPPHAPQLGGQHHDVPYADPQARGIDFQPHLPGFDPPYRQQPSHQSYSQPLYPQEPEAGSMPPPHDDEFYDDTPRGGRRKGLLTVVAVFGLAVVGTAGAFGYRSLFNGPSSSGPPPVIRASAEPSKVAPPPQAPEQSASKFSYDRFGDAGKDERVVRREEKPVDIAPPATQTPRTVFPGVPTPANTGKPNAAMASANPPSALGEPRKVRTVPIRPDLGDVAANSPVAPEPVSVAPPRQVNPPPQPLPSRAADAEPVAAASPPPVAARAATPRAAARVAAHTASAPAPLANAPLSLAPDTKNDFPPPPTAPPPRAAAPTRVASAPSSGGGSYLVQVTSQRSEADAQSSYRSIQQKYASVLGSQPHVVRKADLGSKGVYYRAMVGPFGSREQAVQLCSSLKQAGGDCVVQH
jgi:hypothetical protein